MRFLVDKINSLHIGWNERPLTAADFDRLCRRFRISVVEMPISVRGFYYRVQGRDHIAVDSRLGDLEKLSVMFHELGHFLFHAPETGATASFHHVAGMTREECEADVFALCGLLPKAILLSRSPQELIEDGYPPSMVGARFAVLEKHSL